MTLAIDIPSGIGESYPAGGPAVRADYTFSVGLPKRCFYLPAAREYCGLIRRVRIGFPADLLEASGKDPDGRDWQLIGDDDIRRLMPVPEPAAYKNSRGHLAVFAGNEGTTGAASLCAEAALRTSAGLVSLFAEPGTYPILASKHSAVMVKPEPDNESLTAVLSRFGAVAAGPGWGTDSRRAGQLEIITVEGHGVLDADALSIIARAADAGGSMPDLGGRWVITPHPGEFRRLFPDLDASAPYESVPEAAKRLNAVVLLKGVTSFIAAADGRGAVLDGYYPKLATAGSGDVLCGIIGGYAASGMDVFDAAVLGAAVHLKAAKECGTGREWFTADELLQYTGRVN